MPDAGILATVLLVVGLFLLGLEFFVPSFGLIGSLAAVSLVVSWWSASKAWGGGQNTVLFTTYLVFLIAGVPSIIFGAVYAIQHTSLGNAVVLRPPAATRSTREPLDHLIGQTGITRSLLTPGGMVSVGDSRYHAESVGMVVEPETAVVVVGVSGNRLVVRPAGHSDVPSEPQRETSESQEIPEGRDAEGGSRLDFDIPKDYTT
jgi:membrane-bound serine protease (ClpP class)